MKVNIRIAILIILCFVTISSCKKKEVKADDAGTSVPIMQIMIPNTGFAGENVRIIGKNFGENKDNVQVMFSGKIASIISFSSTEISVLVPQLSGKMEVNVIVNGKTSSSLTFTYKELPEDFSKKDKEAIRAILQGSSPSVWLFSGDSITQGAKHTHGHRPYPEIFSERIRWELGRSEDLIINTAISGHTSKNILNDFEWRIAHFNPKVVSIMVGTNDVATGNNISILQFKSNLNNLISRIRGLGAIPILLTPNTIISSLAPERNRLSDYIIAIRETCQLEGVILVDNWSVWNTEMQSKYNNQTNKFLLNDPLHPNGMGHKEIAISIFKQLSIFNPNDPTCGAKYYEGEH